MAKPHISNSACESGTPVLDLAGMFQFSILALKKKEKEEEEGRKKAFTCVVGENNIINSPSSVHTLTT